MAKQTSSGEAKTPLIVALVICVLLMITFGVLAYMFNSDLATAKEEQKKAQADAKTAQDQLAKEREAKLVYKGALGIMTDTDRTDLQGMRFKEDARKVHADMMKAVDDRVRAAITATAGQFVGAANRPNLPDGALSSGTGRQGGDLTPAPGKSLVDVAVTNYSQRQLAENKFNVEADSLAQAQKTLQALSVKLDETQKQLDTRTKQIPEEISKGIQDVRNQFEQFKGNFNKTHRRAAGPDPEGERRPERADDRDPPAPGAGRPAGEHHRPAAGAAGRGNRPVPVRQAAGQDHPPDRTAWSRSTSGRPTTSARG